MKQLGTFFSLLSFVVLTFGCQHESNDSGIPIDYSYEDASDEKWTCDDFDDFSICKPEEWSIMTTSDVERVYYINEAKSQRSYLAFMKYTIEESDDVLLDYLRELNDNILADTTRAFSQKKLYKIKTSKYENMYSAQFSILEDSIMYSANSFFFKKDDQLIDVTLYDKFENSEENYKIFQTLLHNVRYNDEIYFSNLKIIKDYKELEFDSL